MLNLNLKSRRHRLLKQILVSSGALLMLGSTSLSNLQNTHAEHITFHNISNLNFSQFHYYKHNKYQRHNRKTRRHNKQIKSFLPRPKHHKGKYLSYNQLVPTIKSAYKELYKNNGKGNQDIINKIRLVEKSINHNANTYNIHQVKRLLKTDEIDDLQGNAIKKLNQLNKQFKQARIRQQNQKEEQYNEREWSKNGNDDFAKQVANYTYQDVNNVRQQHGLKPLNIVGNIQKISNMRAKQSYDDSNKYNTDQIEDAQTYGNNKAGDAVAHGMVGHDDVDNDGKKLGIKTDNGWSENQEPIDEGTFHDSADPEGDSAHTETDNTPQQIAYNNVNDMVNYDKFTNNGHRKNMLDKDTTGIGVSAYYNRQGYTRPNSHYATLHGSIIQDYSYGNNPKDI